MAEKQGPRTPGPNHFDGTLGALAPTPPNDAIRATVMTGLEPANSSLDRRANHLPHITSFDGRAFYPDLESSLARPHVWGLTAASRTTPPWDNLTTTHARVKFDEITASNLIKSGAAPRNRTRNPLLTRQVLCQLS